MIKKWTGLQCGRKIIKTPTRQKLAKARYSQQEKDRKLRSPKFCSNEGERKLDKKCFKSSEFVSDEVAAEHADFLPHTFRSFVPWNWNRNQNNKVSCAGGQARISRSPWATSSQSTRFNFTPDETSPSELSPSPFLFNIRSERASVAPGVIKYRLRLVHVSFQGATSSRVNCGRFNERGRVSMSVPMAVALLLAACCRPRDGPFNFRRPRRCPRVDVTVPHSDIEV